MPPIRAVEKRLPWLLAFLALAAMYGPTLVSHARFAAEPLVFNDDSRQFVWPFLMDKQEKRPEDIQYDYRKASMPLGYKALYRAWSYRGDPRTLSKFLPYLLLTALLAITASTASRLGGPACAFASLSMILSSNMFLERMAGGHPRAFAFPLAAGMLWAVVSGRARLLAGLCVASAAFYPVVGVFGGVVLTLWMCLGKRELGETASWPARSRAGLVAGTAALSLLLLAPAFFSMRRFAPMMSGADVENYPEFGPNGRYGEHVDRPPYGSFWREGNRLLRLSLEGSGRPWSPALRSHGKTHRPKLKLILLLLVLAGGGRLAWASLRFRRLLYVPAVLLALHAVAKSLAPALYLPHRYIQYTVPLLAVLWVPWAVAALPLYLKRRSPARRLRPAAVGLLFLFQTLLFGGRGDPQAGFHIQIPRGDWVYPFVATLPADAVAAGWPGPFAAVDSIPYVCARTAFVAFENHEAYYRGYADVMRRRMNALIDAYYAEEPGPLMRLRDDFGATHLILDLRHFQDKPAVYFRPYNVRAKEAFDRAKSGAGFLAPRLAARAGVFNDGRRVVLELSRLPASVP